MFCPRPSPGRPLHPSVAGQATFSLGSLDTQLLESASPHHPNQAAGTFKGNAKMCY